MNMTAKYISFEEYLQSEKKVLIDHEFKKSIEILKDPRLLEKIQGEFDKTITGEWDTRKAIFLSCCSIWVKNIGLPENCLINSESSSGKSYITKQVFKFFPEHLREYRTKISREAFTYWHNSKFEPDWTWDGKILYLEDVSTKLINSETFRVMCTEGSKATVVINQRAVDIEIKGKPCILLTTANANPNLEIVNRFNMVSLDESAQQTHNIIQFHLERATKRKKEEYDPKLKEALNVLRRVNVEIPYAQKLENAFPIQNLRVRRDIDRFLGLIHSSAALHQFQRGVTKEGIVIADDIDYENARQVMKKMQTNELMIALNHKQQKAYQACLELNKELEFFSAKQIHKFKPFCSLKHWYDLLDDLCELGLLKVDIRDCEGSVKPVQAYRSRNLAAYDLPSFKKLYDDKL